MSSGSWPSPKKRKTSGPDRPPPVRRTPEGEQGRDSDPSDLPDDEELMREMRERADERAGAEVDRLARLHDGRNRYQGGM